MNSLIKIKPTICKAFGPPVLQRHLSRLAGCFVLFGLEDSGEMLTSQKGPHPHGYSKGSSREFQRLNSPYFVSHVFRSLRPLCVYVHVLQQDCACWRTGRNKDRKKGRKRTFQEPNGGTPGRVDMSPCIKKPGLKLPVSTLQG